jgi:hypothetical protein
MTCQSGILKICNITTLPPPASTSDQPGVTPARAAAARPPLDTRLFEYPRNAHFEKQVYKKCMRGQIHIPPMKKIGLFRIIVISHDAIIVNPLFILRY